MGIRCLEEGIGDFTIFERGDRVGGVWRANAYPGAACDVPSHLYSFSFAPGSNWSSRYAPRADILDYLEDVTDRFGLRPHLRLSTEVAKAEWDPEASQWQVTLADGESRAFDVVITACGQLTNPLIPDIEGSEHFAGPIFHSARWDRDADLTGKRVAVIGTGASAIQFVPEIAKVAAQTTVYQRSAPWILPKSDRIYPAWERRLFERFPARVKASRLGLFGIFELFTYPFTRFDWAFRPLERVADRARRKAIASKPELEPLTRPNYPMGCKRVLITSDWYPTLARPDVDLIGGEPTEITADGVIGPDGVERATDVIIWGTGFATHDFVAPMEIRGRDGVELTEHWADEPIAFLGTTVPGFPNLFVMYGPNTNHGSGSVPYTLECQFNYAIDAIRRLERGAAEIEVTDEALDEWRDEIAQRSAKTIWVTGGAHNWYLNERGVNTNNWPGTPLQDYAPPRARPERTRGSLGMTQPEITLYWFPISHPAQAARRMLDYKGLEYRKVTIPTGLQPIAMRLYGFSGITVPAMKVGSEKVQGSLEISRRLEEIRPEPPLFGTTDEDRDEIEDAEEWGERELQPVPRRVFRWLAAHRPHVRRESARIVGVPPPLAGAAGWSLLLPVRGLAALGGASDSAVQAHMRDLPRNLDHVDELLSEGVIGGEQPNAADFQIATTIQAMLGISDLRPYIQGRPCADYAVKLMGSEPRFSVPAGLPSEWLPADSR
jgi:cation diffusion facilitator CzcD-associated flavoprotein CzcO/glutathione S-transferase